MEREMDAELRFHIEAFAEDLVRRGAPREEAQRRAQIEFGGVERTKEECREARGLSFIDSLFQDLRFGLRMMRKNLGFTATAVLALALGIGVNTTVFTAFDAVALRPRPVKDPDRLVGVYRTAKGEDYGAFSYPDYIYYRDHTKTLSDLAMWGGETNVNHPGPFGCQYGKPAASSRRARLSYAAIAEGRRATADLYFCFGQLLSIARSTTCGWPVVFAGGRQNRGAAHGCFERKFLAARASLES